MAVFLALKRPGIDAMSDRTADRAHLIALLDRFGAPHPQPDATHWFGEVGKHRLKWEQHTEFATFTLFVDDIPARPFDPQTFDCFPADWLEAAPGARITSALVRVEPLEDVSKIRENLSDWFVAESLAVSTVLDGSAVIAGDFRIDSAGHMRFAAFTHSKCGSRRIGRIVQRLCEIETYKTMSMLGLMRARELGPSLNRLDAKLTDLMATMTGKGADAEQTLAELLETSAELANLGAQSSYRFAATSAYEALVNQRTDVLREERFGGRQSFAEFMMRRFDPAMRTVRSVQSRLQSMAERAARAGDLLRTRVDVERSAQNQILLASMDKRADTQLRLQRTVEGLSVVAISYYAVNLVLFVVAPFAAGYGVSKIVAAAIATPLVIALVWIMVRRIHRSMT
jgi:uncharacterized membrane-anchored protein